MGPLLSETDQCPANQQLSWGRNKHIICVLNVGEGSSLLKSILLTHELLGAWKERESHVTRGKQERIKQICDLRSGVIPFMFAVLMISEN